MDLDHLERFRELDTLDMYGEIHGLPDQLQEAWQLGMDQPLPEAEGIHNIIIAGMGGSAIGADLMASYVEPICPVPVFVQRDYTLPAWANGRGTLMIASSHSGNTEETLSAFEQARSHGVRIMTVSTGGKLGEMAESMGVPSWRFEHQGQPRAAVGYSFGLLLAAIYRLGLIPDPSGHLKAAIEAMREQQADLEADVPVERNPAKRLAGQLYGRWITVIGAGMLEPVARRWKGQMSEVAKTWAQFEFLPEADHNTLAGLENPEELFNRMAVLFLKAPSYHPRIALRTDLTRKVFMMQGINTDVIEAKGEAPLSHMWTALHYGDYTSYYLAMAYGVDPTPIEALATFKKEMAKAG